jgi:glycosyltransferase involved in cell wall biosynthesis
MASLPNSPAFSIVLPTYYRAHILPRAIHSALDQSYGDFELIIVDDASPDDTPEVVQSFDDRRIVYLRLEKNGGPSAARNAGVRRARGKYISFLDDDDEYLPQFLEQMHRAFEAAPERVGFMWCGIRVIEQTAGGKPKVRERLPSVPRFEDREKAYLSFLESLPLGTGWGATVRPACFDAVGLFDNTLETDVDRDFFIRLARRFDFEVISRVLVQVHRHSGPKISAYGPKKARAHEQIIQKNFQALSAHPRAWALWHYKTGWLHYHSGDHRRGREFMLRGLGKCPWHLKSWAGLFILETFGPRGPGLHKFLSKLKGRLWPFGRA